MNNWVGLPTNADLDPDHGPTDRIPILDKGYVRLIDVMGSDLNIVNAARVSFEVEHRSFDNDKDAKLIRFLAKHGHTSPFRHAFLSFEVRAPLMVLNQWHRYIVGSDIRDPFFAWNEVSRRYVRDEPEFYIPEVWRAAPENAKQGSGSSVSADLNADLTEELWYHFKECRQMYQSVLETGICAEQARLFLPAYALYSTVRWSASLQGVLHFLKERLGHGAQVEITDYAKAILELTRPYFPVSVEAWLGE